MNTSLIVVAGIMSVSISSGFFPIEILAAYLAVVVYRAWIEIRRET